jgi:mannose-6-phosphate isomerase-like protein (cupin superfamily)
MELKQINKDKHGFINLLLGDEILNYPEITIFKTEAGMSRGGCFHEFSREHLVVIEGAIRYVYEENGEEKHIVLADGQMITIPPATPHYFISLTDSIVIEWGPTLEEKQAKHEKYRKIVLDINSQYANEI